MILFSTLCWHSSVPCHVCTIAGSVNVMISIREPTARSTFKATAPHTATHRTRARSSTWCSPGGLHSNSNHGVSLKSEKKSTASLVAQERAMRVCARLVIAHNTYTYKHMPQRELAQHRRGTHRGSNTTFAIRHGVGGCAS